MSPEGGAPEVWVAGEPDPAALLALAERAHRLGLPLTIEASWLEPWVDRSRLRRRGATEALTFPACSDRSPTLLAKRALDLVGALALLTLGLPALAALAALVRASDGGPALFAQERVGRYGRRFRMFKLRTMVPGAEPPSDDGPLGEPSTPGVKARVDPRITPIGRWLRRSSLDELPQLLNVLTGDMSLVGPRPPLPSEVEGWEAWQWRRMVVRPGLTGLWQVSGRADLSWPCRDRLDLAYVDGWSLWLDVKLLARTVPAVLSGKGAR